jgi:hypothetical protein
MDAEGTGRNKPLPEAALAPTDTETWTCDRCEVTIQWMAGHEKQMEMPDNWVRAGDGLHCLGCRRDAAAEAATDNLEDSVPLNERVKMQSQARIEFEPLRVPDKANGEIAKACRSSAMAVQKARLGGWLSNHQRSKSPKSVHGRKWPWTRKGSHSFDQM